jgi:hypothetical protein
MGTFSQRELSAGSLKTAASLSVARGFGGIRLKMKINLFVSGLIEPLHDSATRGGKMRAVVTDSSGAVLADQRFGDGTAVIAELLAIKQALVYCCLNGWDEVEIRTDCEESIALLSRDGGGAIGLDPTLDALKLYLAALRRALLSSQTVLIPPSENVARRYASRTNMDTGLEASSDD